MSAADILSSEAVLQLPPMLFGSIRWSTSLGRPAGNPCGGFNIIAEERTASKFRIGASGPEVIPGTGIWKAPQPVHCWAVPDEEADHVVRFKVPDVHLNVFPDGQYRVSVQLTGSWKQTLLQRLSAGRRRVEPFSYYIKLTEGNHIVSVDFEVVRYPLRLLQFG
jgi:hypothetical protein